MPRKGALKHRRGDVDEALTLIEAVLGEQGDAPDAALVRGAAERRKGELLRGEAGILTVARSDTRLRELGVHDVAPAATSMQAT